MHNDETRGLDLNRLAPLLPDGHRRAADLRRMLRELYALLDWSAVVAPSDLAALYPGLSARYARYIDAEAARQRCDGGESLFADPPGVLGLAHPATEVTGVDVEEEDTMAPVKSASGEICLEYPDSDDEDYEDYEEEVQVVVRVEEDETVDMDTSDDDYSDASTPPVLTPLRVVSQHTRVNAIPACPHRVPAPAPAPAPAPVHYDAHGCYHYYAPAPRPYDPVRDCFYAADASASHAPAAHLALPAPDPQHQHGVGRELVAGAGVGVLVDVRPALEAPVRGVPAREGRGQRLGRLPLREVRLLAPRQVVVRPLGDAAADDEQVGREDPLHVGEEALQSLGVLGPAELIALPGLRRGP